MFKCTGLCAKCMKCNGHKEQHDVMNRKIRNITFPNDFLPGESGDGWGIAIDIGTTTVVGMLWDLQKGKYVSAKSMTNPQRKFGSDVISRISFSRKDDDFKILREEIIDCINEIVEKLCRENFIDKEKILKIMICGNTTMSHIFLDFNPSSLAQAPFTPMYKGIKTISAKEAGIKTCQDGTITVLPNIAGHVGGDVTAGILATRLRDKTLPTLLIDIGTNGEIVFEEKGNCVACSTAAGPVFEGAAISCGMPATEGAIEKVKIENGNVFLQVIGDVTPVGLCGSGLVDIIAEMLEMGIINKSGRMTSREEYIELNGSSFLADRLREKNGVREFVLVTNMENQEIAITQKDVRETQLAKGAIAAGIAILMKKMQCSAADISEILLAGAFGNYIDKANGKKIGLIPNVELKKIKTVGNAAGIGTLMALSNESEVSKATSIANETDHIELADDSDFQKIYLENMSF